MTCALSVSLSLHISPYSLVRILCEESDCVSVFSQFNHWHYRLVRSRRTIHSDSFLPLFFHSKFCICKFFLPICVSFSLFFLCGNMLSFEISFDGKITWFYHLALSQIFFFPTFYLAIRNWTRSNWRWLIENSRELSIFEFIVLKLEILSIFCYQYELETINLNFRVAKIEL